MDYVRSWALAFIIDSQNVYWIRKLGLRDWFFMFYMIYITATIVLMYCSIAYKSENCYLRLTRVNLAGLDRSYTILVSMIEQRLDNGGGLGHVVSR